MNKCMFLPLLCLILACNSEVDNTIKKNSQISWRSLPYVLIPYQYPSGNLECVESNDLTNWSAFYTPSTTPAQYGTTSTIYSTGSPLVDRCITLFQNSAFLYWTEYEDGDITWSSPASVASAASPLLPSVENWDGTVHEAHVTVNSGMGQFVLGSNKSGSSWSSPTNLVYSTGGGTAQITSNYSPGLEYHTTADVEYLVTGNYNFFLQGIPAVYWRSTTTTFNLTTNPSLAIGSANTNELNSSFVPVAVDNNGTDQLYIFYNPSGNTTSMQKQLYFWAADVAGFQNGALTWHNSPIPVSGAFTNDKVDGFYDANTQEIIVAFNDVNTQELKIATSSDFGLNWSISSAIDDIEGSPSIVKAP